MVSDSGAGSVGLWKNCTTGGCADTLSYAGEGTCKDIVPSALEEMASPLGTGWPDVLTPPAPCPQMPSRPCRPSRFCLSYSPSSPSWSSCSSSSPWRKATASSSPGPPCWYAVSISLLGKKLSCRSYPGGSQWLEQLSTRGNETALYNLLAWSFVLLGRTCDSCLK